MKSKKLIMLLLLSLMIAGCGNADKKTEAKQPNLNRNKKDDDKVMQEEKQRMIPLKIKKLNQK
ncbi:MAG: hypothetical protein ACLSBH_00360 [Coprobacillus cateniformis]